MNTEKKEEYGLHSTFDLEKHKEVFPNYLEVIVDQKGVVNYAIPSHQEFLIKYICNKGNITRDQLDLLCPERYYYDFMRWLCMVSGCIAVYDRFYISGDELTAQQQKTMESLSSAGVYQGKEFISAPVYEKKEKYDKSKIKDWIEENAGSGELDGVPYIDIPNVPGYEPVTKEEIIEALKEMAEDEKVKPIKSKKDHKHIRPMNPEIKDEWSRLEEILKGKQK